MEFRGHSMEIISGHNKLKLIFLNLNTKGCNCRPIDL